jgi:hypothetical protein
MATFTGIDYYSSMPVLQLPEIMDEVAEVSREINGK